MTPGTPRRDWSALGSFRSLVAPLLPLAHGTSRRLRPPWQERLLAGAIRALERRNAAKALEALTKDGLPVSASGEDRLRALWTALGLATRAMTRRCLAALGPVHPSWSAPLLELGDAALPEAVEVHLEGFSWAPRDGALPGDVTGPLLMRTLPAALRHDLGEYFTPPWLSRRVLRWPGEEKIPLVPHLDPSCGAGGFLAEALRLMAEDHGTTGELDGGRRLLALVTGVDRSPLSVALARLNLLVNAGALVDDGDASPLALPCPVHVGDGFDPALPERLGAPFSRICGNPPWVGWSSLAPDTRDELLRNTEEFDLFEARGLEARLGFANDDLSIPFLLVTAERWLAPRGRLAFLMKGALLRNVAGGVLRRLAIRRRPSEGGASTPPERPLALEGVEDFAALRPFETAAADAVVMRLRRDEPTSFPVPWSRARPVGRRRPGEEPPFVVEPLLARPLDPERPGSPWRLDPPGGTAELDGLEGPGAHAIRHGLKTDCNPCFLVEILEKRDERLRVRNRPRSGRGAAPAHEAWVESRHVHPLIRSRHVRRTGLAGHWHVLLPHPRAGEGDEEELRRDAPLLAAWLEHFRPLLQARRSRLFPSVPFWAVYGIGPYAFAPWRVLWCGMGFRPVFLPVGQVEDPFLGSRVPLLDGALYAIPCREADEAFFLSAVLESPPLQAWFESRSGRGKRGLPASLMKRLALPAWRAEDPLHRELAALGRRLAGRRGAGQEGGTQLRLALEKAVRDLLSTHPPKVD